MMYPKDLLFGFQDEKNPTPLFRNQKELLELIYDEEGRVGDYPDEKRKISLKTFLSNCVNGKRKLSKGLRAGLSAVLDVKLEKLPNAEVRKREIIDSFDIAYQSVLAGEIIYGKASKKGIFDSNSSFRETASIINGTVIKKNAIHQHVFNGFLERSKSAKKVVCTTGTPGEIAGSRTSSKMIEFISQSIGLYGRKEGLKEYRYFFPRNGNDEIAMEFWKKIYLFNKTMGVNDLSKKLNKANSEQIKVYSVDEDIANYPVTCFDYDDYYTEYAYNSNLVDDLLVVMPLNQGNLKWWKENLDSIEITEECEGRKNCNREITFKDAMKVLKNKFAVIETSMDYSMF